VTIDSEEVGVTHELVLLCFEGSIVISKWDINFITMEGHKGKLYEFLYSADTRPAYLICVQESNSNLNLNIKKGKSTVYAIYEEKMLLTFVYQLKMAHKETELRECMSSKSF
jgi:hypothetical protein